MILNKIFSNYIRCVTEPVNIEAVQEEEEVAAEIEAVAARVMEVARAMEVAALDVV
jgi:hypothetical protein